MAMASFRWSELPLTQDGAVQRSVFTGEGAHLKRVNIGAGTTAARHAHPFEQFILVESGQDRLTTADGTVCLEAGMVIHLPPDTWHEAVFETHTVLIEVNLGKP